MYTRVLFISFVLLFGACDDTTGGHIRQVDNHHPPITLTGMDMVEADVSVTDTTISVDTVDTPPDTISPDVPPETVAEPDTQDTVEADTTTVVDSTPETVADTAPTTAEEVDVTPHECDEDSSCTDDDDCTLDHCVNFSCTHEENPACVEDSDNDGFVDIDDLCPLEPEFYDLYEDDDGCPEEDQDHDGYTVAEGDCGDDPSLGNDPASFCWNEYEGYYLRIHFGVGADLRPACEYYDVDGTYIEAVTLFETNGAFLIGPQIDGNDTPGDHVDQDCDGQTNDGEYGLSPPDCYWDSSFDDGSEEVWCWWMDYLE